MSKFILDLQQIEDLTKVGLDIPHWEQATKTVRKGGIVHVMHSGNLLKIVRSLDQLEEFKNSLTVN